MDGNGVGRGMGRSGSYWFGTVFHHVVLVAVFHGNYPGLVVVHRLHEPVVDLVLIGDPHVALLSGCVVRRAGRPAAAGVVRFDMVVRNVNHGLVEVPRHVQRRGRFRPPFRLRVVINQAVLVPHSHNGNVHVGTSTIYIRPVLNISVTAAPLVGTVLVHVVITSERSRPVLHVPLGGRRLHLFRHVDVVVVLVDVAGLVVHPAQAGLRVVGPGDVVVWHGFGGRLHVALDLLQDFRGRSEPRLDSSHARSLVETVVVVLVILVVLLIPKHTEIEVLETQKLQSNCAFIRQALT